MPKDKMSSEKTERWRFVWCNGLAINFNIDWVIEGARYVIFGKPILLTNYLGVRRSQNFFVSGGVKGLLEIDCYFNNLLV